VGVAVRRAIAHEVKKIVRDVRNENYILLDIELKGKRLTLGSVYGPNENNVNFFRELKTKLGEFGMNEWIVGGDFNTILDMDRSIENLDRLGVGRIPNKVNGEFINEWIAEGGAVEPFRALYPEEREVSYVLYRGAGGINGAREFNKSRLDFFLINPEILGLIHSVVYEDRLSMDFDHKEVTLTLGMKSSAGKMAVFDDTLSDPVSEYIGKLAIYECLAAHLTEGDWELTRDVAQLDILIRGLELNYLIQKTAAGGEIVEENIRLGIENIAVPRRLYFPALQ
jgi:hypothetical protein